MQLLGRIMRLSITSYTVIYTLSIFARLPSASLCMPNIKYAPCKHLKAQQWPGAKQ